MRLGELWSFKGGFEDTASGESGLQSLASRREPLSPWQTITENSVAFQRSRTGSVGIRATGEDQAALKLWGKWAQS